MITYGAIRQQVHVMYLPVDDLDDPFVEVVRPMFADWEVRRMDSFRCEDDRIRYVAAHALVRVMLSGLHSTMPAAWALDQAATGRPFVRGPETAPTIDFSLSHTRGMVGCAAAIDATVGFDVEVLDQGLEVRELAPYVMARAEMGRWAEDRCATPVRQLLCYWTLKEALAKALGVGMTVAPTNLVFDLENDGEVTLIGLPELFGPAEEWVVHLAELRGTHVAGVAVNAGACQTVDIHWRCTSAEAVEHSLAMVKEMPER